MEAALSTSGQPRHSYPLVDEGGLCPLLILWRSNSGVDEKKQSRSASTTAMNTSVVDERPACLQCQGVCLCPCPSLPSNPETAWRQRVERIILFPDDHIAKYCKVAVGGM